MAESASPSDSFPARHIGPSPTEAREMLGALGFASSDEFLDAALPRSIRSRPGPTWPARSEAEALAALRALATQNRPARSFIGAGYHDCVTPAVIQRNILENPGWYTAYTPYQAEIAQGRLEALLNFQTLILELTGLAVANASLLDEATAAAEAMFMSFQLRKDEGARTFFVARDCHPQTIEVVRTRAKPLGIELLAGDPGSFAFGRGAFGALLQYPSTDGVVRNYASFCGKARAAGALVTFAADPLALVLLKPPAAFGADIVVGSTQRFGVPLGYGGPHAAYFATREQFRRQMPGRIVGVSKDARGRPALRLALQTREQHIRREKATSNICTAQVLLAVTASMYAVYHGPEGLRRIAGRVRRLAWALAEGLKSAGLRVGEEPFFDTLRVELGPVALQEVLAAAAERGINLRALDSSSLGISLDETTGEADAQELLEIVGGGKTPCASIAALAARAPEGFDPPLAREGPLLPQPVFHRHRSETELLRYAKRLESRDLSLTTSMIPLGSCTMKLNAAAEMAPLSWPEFSRPHPFAPREQNQGYQALFRQLESRLAELTGFSAVSLMPNAGSQGEYAGLLALRAWHESRGEGRRDLCLIPQSAHGTNPASAALAGLEVVPVRCDGSGNVDAEDLKAKAREHGRRLAALMVTYPSTHGVFEETVRELCDTVHAVGGQVYMDGANLNALLGLARPAELGADVCHMNLHKTFCIPHGGGGPGMGPIGVREHLAPFLPRHPFAPVGGRQGIGPVSAAPWGSASVLVIPWMYLEMMGSEGLAEATKAAILNANYVARRLEPHYPVLYKGRRGLVAHECILDLRPLKEAAEVTVEDVAKRLMDYGFHAPTVSFPVAGTLMIEPTESESKAELDRFCEAMILIREEIRRVERGEWSRADNPLKNAPHTADAVAADAWNRPYSREQAVFPAPWTRERKFWPPVGRVDNAWGDRNFFCSCQPPADS